MSSDTSFKLNTGATIPAVGLGTWQAPKGEVGKAVEHALKSGYKHIDAAWCYQVSLLLLATSYILMSRTKMKLERESKRLVSIGRIFSLLPKCTSNPRSAADDSWSTFHDRVEEGLDATLKSLKTDYLDLYLVHWPMYVPA